MTAVIVSIRGGSCRRRKNRAEDAPAIALRRLIGGMQRAAFADDRDDTLNERSNALALSWAMERKLPARRLRCLVGTLDERQNLKLRLAEVEVARAEHELHIARISRVRILQGSEAAEAMWEERDRLFEAYRQATMDMATSPAWSREEIHRKRSCIGRVWLGAEGEWYDRLRAALAEDEARLKRWP